MSKILEYVWLDYAGEVRCKTRVVPDDTQVAPRWRFDGGSTGQGNVEKSDCILNPVRAYSSPFHDVVMILCEVLNNDNSPHETNNRDFLDEQSSLDTQDIWVGVEQEFTIIGGAGYVPPMDEPSDRPEENFYCRSLNVGENVIIKHLRTCLEFGIKYAGFNAEVTPGQWEFQVGPGSPLDVADDLVIARHLLVREFAYHNVKVTFHPKPLQLYNGAGCHINISTNKTRSKELSTEEFAWIFEPYHEDFIENAYGEFNDLRMTGECETSDINQFSVGVGSRNTSIRIPDGDEEVYIEDRRPAACIDPYLAFSYIVEVINVNS